MTNAPKPAETAPVSAIAQEEAPDIQQRSGWLSLPAPYQGLRFKALFTFSRKLARQAFSEIDEDDPYFEERERERFAALGQIVLEHNHWRINGRVLPQPSDPDFWDEIPTELATSIVALLMRETQRLPNSLTQTRRR